jgi:hypothetical protein
LTENERRKTNDCRLPTFVFRPLSRIEIAAPST